MNSDTKLSKQSTIHDVMPRCSYLSVKIKKAGRIYVTEACGCKAKKNICYDNKEEFVCLKHFNSMSKRFELIKQIFTSSNVLQ